MNIKPNFRFGPYKEMDPAEGESEDRRSVSVTSSSICDIDQSRQKAKWGFAYLKRSKMVFFECRAYHIVVHEAAYHKEH